MTLLLWAWRTVASGETLKQIAIDHFVSVFVNFPGWSVSGIIVGVLLGLIVGAIQEYPGAMLNPSYKGRGRASGGIVGFFAGVVIWGTMGGLIVDLGGRDLGAAAGICIVISLSIGPYLCMLAGASIGKAIGEKWV